VNVNWHGVIPAITSPFDERLRVDHALFTEHARWLVDAGCVGIVPFGSLGEGATLAHDEKITMLEALVGALDGSAPVIPAVSALSTAEAVRFAKDAAAAGASGFMVLPPYVYASDWREMRAHVAAILAATPLPAMLYNNPLAYTTDFAPPQVHELAQEHPNLEAIKESSTDLRRVAWLRSIMPESFAILMGVDDLALEAFQVGAVGWIAGLVNALPHESVRLFDLAQDGRVAEAFDLYRWFLPLLRLDIGTKFVQKIKLAQEHAGWGGARVRPPRLELAGAEREAVMRVITEGFAARQGHD
jgi:1-pyrroline-4-hydroxy-2-carboxylate deaminase